MSFPAGFMYFFGLRFMAPHEVVGVVEDVAPRCCYSSCCCCCCCHIKATAHIRDISAPVLAKKLFTLISISFWECIKMYPLYFSFIYNRCTRISISFKYMPKFGLLRTGLK